MIAVVLMGIILSLIGNIFEHCSSIIIELTDYSIWSILIGYNNFYGITIYLCQTETHVL